VSQNVFFSEELLYRTQFLTKNLLICCKLETCKFHTDKSELSQIHRVAEKIGLSQNICSCRIFYKPLLIQVEFGTQCLKIIWHKTIKMFHLTRIISQRHFPKPRHIFLEISMMNNHEINEFLLIYTTIANGYSYS